MPPTRALVHIDPLVDDVNFQVQGLKRIALLFDEIHYKVATGWQLKDDVATDSRRYRRAPEGHLIPAGQFTPFVGGYNPLDDVFPTFILDMQSWDAELRETIEALNEAGIAKRIDEATAKSVDPSDRMGHLRSLFVETDYKDETFSRLSGDNGEYSFTFGRFELAPILGDNTPSELHYIIFPATFRDSIALTETLYFSHVTNSNSVFLRPRFQPELDHRFRRFQEAVETLSDTAPELAASLRVNAHFGQVAFNVANSIVNSELLATKSVDELIRFRAETDDSRQRFISTGLSEIDSMVSENAWSPAATEEMNQYIRTKLAADIVSYDDATTEVWEKLFGSIRIRLARVTSATVLGGAASHQLGGLLGNVLPNASGLSVLLVAALALAKEAPSFARDLEEVIELSRKPKRSAIAYVSRLSELR